MIKVWFVAMKRISSIGGCVSILLVLALSASDGYCFGKIKGWFHSRNNATSKSNTASNGIPMNNVSQKDLNNIMQGVQNTGNAIQKTLQSQQIQQQLQAGQQRLAQENAQLRRSMSQKLSNSASLQQQEKMLELQRAQSLAENEQQIKMLRNQLNQAEAKQKAQMKNIDKQISSTRFKIKAAKMKENIQKQAGQIFTGIKNKFSNLKKKLPKLPSLRRSKTVQPTH